VRSDGARPKASGWLRELRRAATWHRRLLVAGLLAASVAFAIEAVSPEPPPGVAVVVAADDLPAGTRLTTADVRVQDLASSSVPAGALHSVADVDSRSLVAPVRAGEVITDVRLVGRSYLESYGEALVAAPVRISDAASVRLLHAGDVVDVLAAGAGSGATSGEARLVASAVQVITIPQEERSALGPADVGDGALVVVVTTSPTAARMAAAAVTDRLSVVIR
jgi:Flp pilus assembly protein CpaB